MGDIKLNQKKEWAQTLFVAEGMSQKEISAKTGISAQTINKWVNENDGRWKTLRTSMIVTRQEQLKRIYMQIQELNTFIMQREEGQRFANSKEADTLTKLSSAARNLENDTSIADVIEVSKQVLQFVRRQMPGKSEEIAIIFDEFIKDKLKRG